MLCVVSAKVQLVHHIVALLSAIRKVELLDQLVGLAHFNVGQLDHL